MSEETTNVVFSGPVLSLLALDSFVTAQKEGYLIGRVTVSEKTSISDADGAKHERHTTVDSVCTTESRFQFEDVEKSRVRYGFGDSQVKVIGWYRARRQSSLVPSCRESIAHRQLIDARVRAALCDSDKKSLSATKSNICSEPFIFALFVHSKTSAGAQHGLDYAAFTLQSSSITNQRQCTTAPLLSSVNVRVANLADGPQAAYLPVPTFATHSFGDLIGASRTLTSKLERYKRDSTDAQLMREMHDAAQESLKKLCTAILQTAIKQMSLRNEVQRLEAERLALLPKTSSAIEAVVEDEENEETSRIATEGSNSALKSTHLDALRPELRQTMSDAQRRKSHNTTSRTDADPEQTRIAHKSGSFEKERELPSTEVSASSRTTSQSRQFDTNTTRGYLSHDADVDSALQRASGDRTLTSAGKSSETRVPDMGRQSSNPNYDEQDFNATRTQQSDRSSKRPVNEITARLLSEATAGMSISSSNSSRTSALSSGLGSSSHSYGTNVTLPVGSSNVHSSHSGTKYSSVMKESTSRTNPDRDRAGYKFDTATSATALPATPTDYHRERNRESESDYVNDAYNPSVSSTASSNLNSERTRDRVDRDRDRDPTYRSAPRAVSERDERTAANTNNYGQSTLPKPNTRSNAARMSPPGAYNTVTNAGTNLHVSGSTSYSRSGAKRE